MSNAMHLPSLQYIIRYLFNCFDCKSL